jgi:hypothetical protein
VRHVVVVLLAWLCAAAPHAAEPAYWERMPEAVRLRADVQGSNALDTAARQHAAAVLLQKLVERHGEASGVKPWPQRDRELNAAYFRLMGESVDLGRAQGQYDALHETSLRYQADAAFVQTLLARYFTPADLKALEPALARWRGNAATGVQRMRREALQVRAQAAQQEKPQQRPRQSPVLLALFTPGLLLLAGALLFRWLPDVKLDPANPMNFNVRRRRYALATVSGVARGVTKGIEKDVHLGGGQVYTDAQGMVRSTPITAHTTTTVRDQFFIETAPGREAAIQATGLDLALRDGQRLTGVFAHPPGAEQGPYVLFHNHHTQKTTMVCSALRKLLVPPAWWIGAGFVAITWCSGLLAVQLTGEGIAALGGLVLGMVAVKPMLMLAESMGEGQVKRFAGQLAEQVVPRL